MLLKNVESDDLSNLLQLSLDNLGYSSKQVTQYVFLIEEALGRWKNGLDPESVLSFNREDTAKDSVFIFSVKERKLDPFAKEEVSQYDKPLRTMYDKLMFGIGTELKYRYRNGTNQIVLRLPKKNIRDTLFNRTALSMIIAFATQILIQNIAANIDVLMLGFLSSSAMSGVAFASQVVLIHSILLMALTNAASTLFSQLYGQRKTKSVIFALKLSIVAATVVNAAEFIVCFFLSKQLMGLYTHIPELIASGSQYLKLVSVTFLFDAVYVLIFGFLRVIDKRSVVTKVLAVGCSMNILLNALLIFGFLGIPQLGVTGAAIATLSSSLIQLVLTIVYFIKKRKVFFFDTDTTAVDRAGIRKVFIANASPIVLQYGVYLMGMNFLSAAVGRLNADIIAAYSFLNTINSYLFSVKDGCSEVSSILTGMQLSRNNFDDALHNSWLIRKLCVKLSLGNVAVLVLLAFGFQFLPFQLSDAAKGYLLPLMLIFSINVILGYQNSIGNGFLYAGGESRSAFLMDALNALCVSVPLSLISIKTNIFPPMVVLFLSKADELISFLPKFLTAKRGKWLRNVIDGNHN